MNGGVAVDIYSRGTAMFLSLHRPVRLFASVAGFAAIFSLFPTRVLAQEAGRLSLVVNGVDGAALVGATVELSGEDRTTVRGRTDARGVFTSERLRPGQYSVIVATGWQRFRTEIKVVAGRAVAYRVNGGDPIIDVASTSTSANVTAKMIESLPLAGRNFGDLANLTPGIVRDMGGLSINGGVARDNKYLVDGLPAQDWVTGRQAFQYLPDSIDRIEVQTSNYSAEYGRFTGGVVNYITKSPANEFGGAFRVYFDNESWGGTTDLDEERGTKPSGSGLNLQATLGGPLINDKLWFFGGYRGDNRTDERQLSTTRIPYDADRGDWGGQASLNYKFSDDFRLKAFYSLNGGDETTTSSRDGITEGTLINPNYSLSTASLGLNRSFGSSLIGDFYGNYWRTSIKDRGGLETAFNSSPIVDFETGAVANFPFHDGTVPIDRSSLTFGANLTWSAPKFLPESSGTHQLKFGLEYFSGSQEQSAARSATGHTIFTDLLRDNQGQIQLDNQGLATPLFRQFQTAAFGTDAEDPRQFKTGTFGFYGQDTWKLNDRWSFNLGVRLDSYDWKLNDDTLGSKLTVSPRLSVTGYFPQDKGWYTNFSYARLNSQIFENLHGGGLMTAEKSTLFFYTGPSGAGYNFSPAFDKTNYFPVARVDETVIKTIEDDVAPVSYDAYSASAWHSWSKGSLRFGWNYRSLRNAVDDGTGPPVVVTGNNNSIDFDSIRYFSTNELVNKYQSVWTDLRYQPSDKLRVGLNYTYQLDHSGNYEFDKKDGPITALGDYPEIFSELRHYPVRNLEAYQPNDFAVWMIWTAYTLNQLTIDLSSLFHAESGRYYPYTVVLPLTPIQEGKLDPARVQSPISQLLYFDGETGHYDSKKTWNFGAMITRRNLIPGVDLFGEFQVHNLLGGQAWTRGGDTSITPIGPFDADGLPTGFELGPTHGEPTRSSGIQDPRRFSFAFGLKF